MARPVESIMTSDSSVAASPIPANSAYASKLLRVAWMSIVLGLVVQGVVIAITRTMPQSLAAELAGKFTWSVIVCTAVAIASIASKALPPVVGAMGLLAAPLAIAAARTVQKAVASGMSGSTATTVATATPAPGAWELAIAKAVQYAVFGWLICRAQKKGTLAAHLAVSVPIGVVFALYLAWRTWTTTEPEALKPLVIAAKSIGDATATIGCSVVLWAGVSLAAKKA